MAIQPVLRALFDLANPQAAEIVRERGRIQVEARLDHLCRQRPSRTDILRMPPTLLRRRLQPSAH